MNRRYLPRHVPHGIGLYSQGLGQGYAAIADALKVMQGLKFDYLTNKAKLEALQREKLEQRTYTEAMAEQTLQNKLGFQIAAHGGEPELGDTQAMFNQLAELAQRRMAIEPTPEPTEPLEVKFPSGQWTPESMERYATSVEQRGTDYSLLRSRPPTPKPDTPSTAELSATRRIRLIENELASLTDEFGDVAPGKKSRYDSLQQQKTKLLARLGITSSAQVKQVEGLVGPDVSAVPGQQFRSPQEVAMSNLSKQEKLRVLREQFGLK